MRTCSPWRFFFCCFGLIFCFVFFSFFTHRCSVFQSSFAELTGEFVGISMKKHSNRTAYLQKFRV